MEEELREGKIDECTAIREPVWRREHLSQNLAAASGSGTNTTICATPRMPPPSGKRNAAMSRA